MVSIVFFQTSSRLLLFVFSLFVVACGQPTPPVHLKTKIAPQRVALPTSDNVDAWMKDWDRKTLIVGMSEDKSSAATDALDSARRVLAGALIRRTNVYSVLDTQEIASLERSLAGRFQLERQALHDDSFDSPGVTKNHLNQRLSVYFLQLSDVRSALVELQQLGVESAGQLLMALNTPAGISDMFKSFELTWPIAWVEPNLTGYLKSPRRADPEREGLGLAPEFKYNTSIVSVLKRIRADSAFTAVEKTKQNLPAVTVAILDTGVDSLHPELKDQMFVNPSEKADGQDNDNNCFVDDVHGIDATSECGRDPGVDPKPGHADLGGPGKSCPRLRPNDELSANCGHGSHVAGIIAAKHGGDLSTMGICPSCKILSIRVSERCVQPNTQEAGECVRPTKQVDPMTSYEVDGGISDTSQIRALTYLYNLRAPDNPGRLLVNVVNLSLGKYFASRTMSYIIRNLQRKNIIVVAAAGNDGTETPSYPAAYDTVVSVCATSEDYAQGAYGRAPFSNFGDWVDICAPGTDIVSTVPGKTTDGGGLFIDKSGTSQATPFVAGALGYLLSVNGNNKSATQIIDVLKSAADSESLYNASYNRVPGTNERLYRACYTDTSICDNLLGAGFLDLDAAVQSKKQSKTNFNFLANQPGGCIVSSISSARRSADYVVNAFGSMPAVLLFWIVIVAAFRMMVGWSRRRGA